MYKHRATWNAHHQFPHRAFYKWPLNACLNPPSADIVCDTFPKLLHTCGLIEKLSLRAFRHGRKLLHFILGRPVNWPIARASRATPIRMCGKAKGHSARTRNAYYFIAGGAVRWVHAHGHAHADVHTSPQTHHRPSTIAIVAVFFRIMHLCAAHTHTLACY